jgi:predicted PurR-regulated permease PerM
MPDSGRLISNRTIPGRDEGCSLTVIGWPMTGGDRSGTIRGRHKTARYRRRIATKVATKAAPPPPRPPVPWRTIWAAVAAVVLTAAGLSVLLALSRILAWMVVAVFLATVLTPPVDFLHHKAKIRRGLATGLVYLVGVGALAGLLYAFIAPLVDQAQNFADDLPGYVEDAREGRGTIGELVERYDLQKYVDENQDELQDFVSSLGTPAVSVLRTVFATVAAGVTILVLAFLILLQGPKLTRGSLELVPERHRERVRRVSADCARAVSGYIFGNLLISVIAGVASWIMLLILGVPYAGVLALWVAFTDLIPLVGATVGAVPTVGFAFLHSVPAGIAAAIFFIVYQQFENHVLQVSIMSRTVNVNPLTVLVSIIIGVELTGLLGALLAIPAAGVVQVVVRDLWDERRGRLKDVPSTGADEVPITP